MSLMSFYYDPFTEFDRLFDDAFSSRFRPASALTEAGRDAREVTFRPRMDLHEDPESNTVSAIFDLPGLKQEDVRVDIHSDRLTVSGEKKVDQQRDEAGYSVRERSYGKFTRTLILPQGTKPEDVKAKMESGVLTVTFPKAQPQPQPKRIDVK
ncbi:small heat shock protein [Paxillus ammoniavirescens]|nr:small heat shock protein [Paxillus ammoniavirescens]